MVIPRILAVAFGGAIGAVARYLLSGWIGRLAPSTALPWGTLAVNVLGSLLLGLLLGASEGRIQLSVELRAMLGVGLLGALTTFSTFSYETLELLGRGELANGVLNVLLNVVLTLAACWLGLQLGGRL